MRPKFWYCSFCGFMFLDTGTTGGAEGNLSMDCPMCGEEVMPCWESIWLGIFDRSWCRDCPNGLTCVVSPGRTASA